MNPSVPVARRSNTLSSSLGLGEKLFASSDERKFARAIETGLEEVEAGLLREMSFADNLADVTSRYLLEAGGKRVRPMLTLLTAQLGTGNNTGVVTAAEAIEITHLASLYHDDVMDEAQMRRGVPSAQAVWGNSVAILTVTCSLLERASWLRASARTRSSCRQTLLSVFAWASCTKPSDPAPTRIRSLTISRCSPTRLGRSSRPRLALA